MDRFSPSSDVIAREVGGEQVLLDMRTGTYFGLNPVGTAIWQALEQEPLDLEQLTRFIDDRFEVEFETARGDVAALLDELQSRDLIRVAA